jgi:hypothetical protein
MLRRWAHVVMAALLHLWLLLAVHEMMGQAVEMVRDEIAVSAFEGGRAIALGR